MKYKITRLISLCFILGISSPCIYADNQQKVSGKDGEYSLVWQDLFDEDVLNETDNWSIEVNGDGGGNSELQYYRRENISLGTEPVEGSHCLIITAKKEGFGGKTATSGRLTTQHKMTFKHGKIEARIKLPHTADGLWPAFWLLGNTNPTEGWPRCGEIDILEMGNATGIKNNTQDRYFNGACHWGYYENGWYPNYAKASTNSYGMQDDFHLFTMVWDENMIQMYLDQDKYPDVEPYYAMDISSRVEPKDPGNYLHRPFFVIFNLAVGGNFTGIWDINKITALSGGEAKMYVDYVKVYQKGTEDEEFSGPKLPPVSLTTNDAEAKVNFESLGKTITVSGLVKRVSLYTMNGICLLDKYDSNVVQLSCLRQGLYIVNVEMQDGKSISRKLWLK